jgi:hypothetical protein
MIGMRRVCFFARKMSVSPEWAIFYCEEYGLMGTDLIDADIN